MNYLNNEKIHVHNWQPYRTCGLLSKVSGNLIEVQGLSACLGELCKISSTKNPNLLAEVIGFHNQTTLLMSLSPLYSVALGTEVLPLRRPPSLHLSDYLLGRVLDAFGNPMDNKEDLPKTHKKPLLSIPPSPMVRQPIDEIFPTGIKAIDAFLTLGKGQRIGVFSEPGSGKSSLLSAIALGSKSTINVIALIGERGREVREYIERHSTALKQHRTVIIAAPAHDTAPTKVIAGRAAMTIAEYFRDQGHEVLFVMDSLSRWIAALQEVALARGETLSAHQYAASVFHHVSEFTERAGNNDKGSITALYAILYYPKHPDIFTDYLKSLLDGHFFLTSQGQALASPPIDILSSLSRSAQNLALPHHYAAAERLRSLLKVYNEALDIIRLGAYTPGQDEELDKAVQLLPSIKAFLTQPLSSYCYLENTLKQLEALAES
ncbi:Probable ATP synthase YscN,type III secretion system ATPase,F0F1-type ATP synthase, beta subunit,type III secretion apparatus H -transporting two-sector ATPase,ATP synthase alpha/beta family, nucleotide-binding domain [Chlamydia serpentis]|uniref:Probable ATP synthase YscN,type III secretion system ATPase,F0F1-type ATP synthase, beta subunit,type III secretion apparatus H -transporting two-sector ATPase,ATP synthase alpha/beta family, nucle... n=1 Tax=Chlamydia serpentis TaxID=1967782 RepID=A0A2R8FC21_9CHLA|nr:FliI/YscN family ATPase [Chlamydia serpentis]SPN73970.1 Probable ATP synthase YscN,type III secretion system ATPase,F0F1-type ATP synthase, beta subunit,type III secretion apparatus H -transporting two-sector ATPase,ATP synthase alpha/beta family, nucleotide-binding domain [Chlamydia serpentis]